MRSKFNKLKKQMELQLTDEIFFTNEEPIQKMHGWFYPTHYSAFHYEIKKYDYKINKNVFDLFSSNEINEVLYDMSQAWSEWPYDEAYEDEEDELWCKEYNTRMHNICLDTMNEIKTKYEYYIELYKLYDYILDYDTECKTLPNKRYTQKRCVGC
ncbi:MAG: hypothetical protein J6S85_25115 [Methanobrevibacter sp.]|nr:hypothetical protein [Methanobrevibacter sp.]